MTPNQLEWYYASADLAADGESLPIQLVTEDSSNESVIPCVGEASWIGAVGWFALNTASAALRGQFFAIADADANGIRTVIPLPTTPVAGDKFVVARGLGYRSATRIPFCRINGFPPTLTTVSVEGISGVTIRNAVATRNLWLIYDSTDEVLRLSADATSYGPPLDVSSDVANGYIQAPTGDWISVDVAASELPAEDATATLFVTPIVGSLVPPVWVEAEATERVLHAYAALRHSGSESVSPKTISDTSGSAYVADTYNDGDQYIDLYGVESLPLYDFWLCLDESPADVRYVVRRAGSRVYLADTSEWMEVEFDGGSTEPVIGATVSVDSATGTLEAVSLESGSWAGGDAAGIMVVSRATGLFSVGQPIVQDSVSLANVVDARWAIRGLTRRVSWPVGAVVRAYPYYDVAVVPADSGLRIGDADRARGVVDASFGVWSYLDDRWEGADCGAMENGDVVGVVIRRYLVAEMSGNLRSFERIGAAWS